MRISKLTYLHCAWTNSFPPIWCRQRRRRAKAVGHIILITERERSKVERTNSINRCNWRWWIEAILFFFFVFTQLLINRFSLMCKYEITDDKPIDSVWLFLRCICLCEGPFISYWRKKIYGSIFIIMNVWVSKLR